MTFSFPDRYLGDGVYASFDGYHVVLDLRAQGPDRIALDPAVFANLLDYHRATIEAVRLHHELANQETET